MSAPIRTASGQRRQTRHEALAAIRAAEQRLVDACEPLDGVAHGGDFDTYRASYRCMLVALAALAAAYADAARVWNDCSPFRCMATRAAGGVYADLEQRAGLDFPAVVAEAQAARAAQRVADAAGHREVGDAVEAGEG